MARRVGLAGWGPAHDTADFAFSKSMYLSGVSNSLARWRQESVVVPVSNGVDEIAFALTVDAIPRTMRRRRVVHADGNATVIERQVLRLVVERGVAGETGDDISAKRIILPSASAPSAAALISHSCLRSRSTATFDRVVPDCTPQFARIHIRRGRRGVAYERFWDLHLTAGAEFDFPNDIAEYARYQRQIKTENKIAGPALMLIDQFGTWGKAAALLLSRFNGMEVCVAADTQEMVNFGVPDLMKGLDSIEPNKDKCIPLKLPTRLAKIIGPKRPPGISEKRFDTAGGTTGYTCRQDGDFFAFSAVGAALTGDMVVFGIPRITDSMRHRLMSDRLAAAGYLATMVDFRDVAKAVEDRAVASAIQWLVGKKSKLRINAHGDGEGNLEMGVNESNKMRMSSARLVDWMVANGLKTAGEWKTFSLFVCMAARYKDIPAGTEEDKSSPATQSSVWNVADALGKHGINGVKVTGANEVTWGVHDLDGITTTGGIRPGQSVQMIAMPAGWQFNEQTMTLTAPNDWKIESKVHEGKTRLLLSLTQTGAKVAANPNGGWDFEASGKKHYVPLTGWTVDNKNALLIATDGWRHAGGLALRYVGSGGAVGIRTASGVVEIVERLAKSGAKFAAVSGKV